MPRRFVSLILLFLVVFTMSGCMGDDDSDDGTDDGADASSAAGRSVEEILGAASNTWAETESAHFTLEIDGDAYLDEDETIKLLSAEGDIKRPGSVTAEATIDAAITVVDISLRAVDGEIFITNLLSGNWERAPDDFSYDPSVLFSDTDGIGPIMTDLKDPELDGTENVNGQSANKVTGTVTADRVEAITAGTIAGDDIDVTLWTGVDDGKLLRVVLTEPKGVRDSPATWNLDMTDHNKEIEIKTPVIPTRTS